MGRKASSMVEAEEGYRAGLQPPLKAQLHLQKQAGRRSAGLIDGRGCKTYSARSIIMVTMVATAPPDLGNGGFIQRIIETTTPAVVAATAHRTLDRAEIDLGDGLIGDGHVDPAAAQRCTPAPWRHLADFGLAG